MKHRNLKNIFCYNSSFSSLVSSFGLGGGGGYFFVFPTKTKSRALRKNGIKLLRNVWSDSEDLTKKVAARKWAKNKYRYLPVSRIYHSY